MEIRISALVPFDEYKKIVEDLFQTKLTDEEAGRFIFNKQCQIEKGILLKDPARTLKESVAPPQTITFLVDLAKDLAIGVASEVISIYLFNVLQKRCSWLKIGDKESKITLEDIRKVVNEELEKSKNDDTQKS
jgi:hypothetical protein